MQKPIFLSVTDVKLSWKNNQITLRQRCTTLQQSKWLQWSQCASDTAVIELPKQLTACQQHWQTLQSNWGRNGSNETPFCTDSEQQTGPLPSHSQ